MKLVDVNILLYAVNQDAIHHERIRRWLENALSGQEPVGLAWVALLGFVRLATNPKVFPNPLSAEEAMKYVDDWLQHDNARLIIETEEHWNILRSLLVETGTSGNLTTDAHLASLAIAHGATLVSCDLDFRRFPRLLWESPTSP